MTETASDVLTGLGGLALFLYGMLLLSGGLKAAAGDRFRRAMRNIASHRLQGYLLGTLTATAVHSSATTVMVVGLLNAGLLTLAGSIPLIAGANLGTTLAMQFIAFDIGWLWSVLAITGMLLRFIPGGDRQRRIGEAVIGLSLLFLGMRLMGQSAGTFRTSLAGWLSASDTLSWGAFMAALGGATAFTLIVQSSGATIGILFSLAGAGVFTSIEQAMPYIIGAQIGTCITALLSSVGTNADARRGALGHLYFNVVTAVLSIALLPWLQQVVRALDDSVVRQIAHAHTAMMLLGGLVVVPASRAMAALLRATARFPEHNGEQSHLDAGLLHDPPAAVTAARRELVRASHIVRRGFACNRKLVSRPDRSTYRLVKNTEKSMDLIYHTMRDYLMRLSAGTMDVALGARIQWMNLSLIFLERISDHNDNLADLTMEINHRLPDADLGFAHELCDELYRSVEPLLASLESAWAPDAATDGPARARVLREQRSQYLPESERLQGELVTRIAAGTLKPITGFMMTEYISEMDRIVRHTKKIAGILEKSGT